MGSPALRPRCAAVRPSSKCGLLPAVWRITAWFKEDAASERSPYLRVSEARLLISEIGPALAAAGIAVPDGRDAHGEAYRPVFEKVLEAVFAFLNPPALSRPEISTPPGAP